MNATDDVRLVSANNLVNPKNQLDDSLIQSETSWSDRNRQTNKVLATFFFCIINTRLSIPIFGVDLMVAFYETLFDFFFGFCFVMFWIQLKHQAIQLCIYTVRQPFVAHVSYTAVIVWYFLEYCRKCTMNSYTYQRTATIHRVCCVERNVLTETESSKLFTLQINILMQYLNLLFFSRNFYCMPIESKYEYVDIYPWKTWKIFLNFFFLFFVNLRFFTFSSYANV